jgi:hypothetical protein
MPDSGLVSKEYEKNKVKPQTETEKYNDWAASLVGGRKNKSARRSKKVQKRKSFHRKSNRRSVARRSVAHRSRKSRSSRKNRK